jgi:hypothetical protein
MTQQLNFAHWIAGQAGVIPLSLGIPGVAKTEMHRAMAKAAGRVFRALMLDQCLPEDLGGYPVVRQIGCNGSAVDVMAKVHDERFVRCRLEPSVLLIDELTNVGHSTQAAALQVMAEGIEGCWIYAAANPIDKAAAGVDLTPPMVNRLCVLQWETDREAVLKGWRHGFVFPEPSIPILPDNWRDFCPKWGTLLAMFIERFPDLLEAFPHDLAKASEPWPSPRSWTNVGLLRAAGESIGASDETLAKMDVGCVGLGAASQWQHWLEEQGLPDPEWLLEHPSRLVLPRRGDMAIAIISSVFNRVRSVRTPDRWEAACDVLEHAYAQQAEVAMAALGSVWKLKPDGYSPRNRNGKWAEMNKALIGSK